MPTGLNVLSVKFYANPADMHTDTGGKVIGTGWLVRYKGAGATGITYHNINVLIETRGVSYWIKQCLASGGTYQVSNSPMSIFVSQ
jgi:hypothetical protein